MTTVDDIAPFQLSQNGLLTLPAGATWPVPINSEQVISFNVIIGLEKTTQTRTRSVSFTAKTSCDFNEWQDAQSYVEVPDNSGVTFGEAPQLVDKYKINKFALTGLANSCESDYRYSYAFSSGSILLRDNKTLFVLMNQTPTVIEVTNQITMNFYYRHGS